jgi:ribosomal protein S12 methylthiotransferase RimO
MVPFRSCAASNLHNVPPPSRSVALLTLGCARNEVDSEELAGRLAAEGWELRPDAEGADVVVVNTCGFIDSAKKDSIDTLLAAADSGGKVVAVGCLAERYGQELAEALPEADAVLGFDSYAEIGRRLDDITPAQRPAAAADVALPGHAWIPTAAVRSRLDDAPTAYLKLASGCDRRCTFCAIPSFRGAFVSRPAADVLAEAEWLASTGARELVLVSENSTSYGKDLGDLRALEQLLPRLAAVDGVERVRVSYLQPAELRPDLLRVLVTTPGIAPYLDLSFQHASTPVLRRMKRFGGTDSFLELLAGARALAPELGARSNVIVGFPGETEDDVRELERFLSAARLDAIGVFGYSDEDGTEAAGFDDKVPADEIIERVGRISALADELVVQRAEERIGTTVDVLVEDVAADEITGRAAHQGPDVDGVVRLAGKAAVRRGQFVPARVVACDGVDLLAEPVGPAW